MKKFLLVFVLCFCLSGSCLAAMEFGDQGTEVLDVQKQLVVKGFNPGPLNGSFGHVMENAVKSFQYENKLDVTGKVDKETYLLLMERDLPDRYAGERNISLIRRLVGFAVRLRGVPYVFGGTSVSGFDCSGFMQHVFGQAGILLPRMADEQYEASKRIHKPRAGDMVFFETYAPGVSHVGLYLGNRKFIHASSSRGVTISSLDDDYYSSRYVGAGRVL